MKPQDIILLAGCLRDREAAFVTVHECEARIRARLGGAAFPLPAPPDLPSTRRHLRPGGESRRTPAMALRRLRAGEDAYRLTCRCGDRPCTSLTQDPEVVRALLETPRDVLAVERLEAVSLDDAGAVTGTDCLWNADGGAQAGSVGLSARSHTAAVPACAGPATADSLDIPREAAACPGVGPAKTGRGPAWPDPPP
jgi:hypothetical protein